jgi:hypothetical protein
MFVAFAGSFDVGIVTGQLDISGLEILPKIVPLKTIVTKVPTPSANPSSLAGFTAVQNVSASVLQSFNLTVNGLPFTGNPFITITAPTGYSVALSAKASFVNAFVVFANNGNINSKYLYALTAIMR